MVNPVESLSTFFLSFQVLIAGTVPSVVRTSSIHPPTAFSCLQFSSSGQRAASSGSRNWHAAVNEYRRISTVLN